MGKKRKKADSGSKAASSGGEDGHLKVGERQVDGKLELLEDEELLFLGQAQLEVLEGAVAIGGARVEAGQMPLPLAADAQLGGPLLLAAAHPAARPPPPLASPRRALLRLTDAPGQPAGFSLQPRSAADAPTFRPAPPAWHEAVQSILEASVPAEEGGPPPQVRVAVAGTRQIGKSSFARLLVNGLLARHAHVALLDTDLGQPELTVPGLVSLSLVSSPLLGPPHLHQHRPAAAAFLGDVSPQQDPAGYTAAVTSLLSYYREECSDSATGALVLPPLVVNTHGWIQGLGLELLAQVLAAVGPTHAVMLQSSNPRRNLPREPFWLPPGQTTPSVLCLPGIGPHGMAPGWEARPGGPKPPAAVEVRGLAWLAFARRCCGLPGPPPAWDAAAFAAAAAALAGQRPFAVAASAVRVQLLHARVPAARAAAALNGCVVGLAAADSLADGAEPAPLRCLGVGLVRAVDAAKGLLFLLTDLPLAELEAVAVLQAGRLELPPALLQTGELRSPYLCLWGISAEGSGAGVIKSRNNLARPGQL